MKPVYKDHLRNQKNVVFICRFSTIEHVPQCGSAKCATDVLHIQVAKKILWSLCFKTTHGTLNENMGLGPFHTRKLRRANSRNFGTFQV